MTSDQGIAWLRKAIEGDRDAATIISDGGYAPERWDTVPPGQVSPSAENESKLISRLTGQEPGYSCGWVRIGAWERLNSEPAEAAQHDPGAVVALAELGRRQFDHICRHDPQDVVADCEAKLAIIAWHEAECTCTNCDVNGDPLPAEMEYPCQTVRLLASAYRHRDGYGGHWGR